MRAARCAMRVRVRYHRGPRVACPCGGTRTYEHRHWGREQRASTDNKAPAIASADSRAVTCNPYVILHLKKSKIKFRVRDSNPGLERERLIS